MRVRVTTLRDRGQRTRRAENGGGVVGNLELSGTMHKTELVRVARLTASQERSSKSIDLIAPLYSPELATIGAESLLLRGYQADEDGAFVQEWHCRFER